MHIWGLNILDVAIIVLYVAVILWLGKRAGRKTKDIGDFYLAGRKLGRFYQFFLNFGCSTNADQAVAARSDSHRGSRVGLDDAVLEHHGFVRDDGVTTVPDRESADAHQSARAPSGDVDGDAH